MIDFETLKGLTIPEGVVVQIAIDGAVVWRVSNPSEPTLPISLEVEKITSNTYAGETSYSNESFILLDIYPKTNGTVNITYNGLTKTITDTSGAAEPNAQQVFFGTFNGVSDSVTTPDSGTLIIEGDYAGFAVGVYKESSKVTDKYCNCVISINDFGSLTVISKNAFKNCAKIQSVNIPQTIKKIGDYNSIIPSDTGAFMGCTGLVDITLSDGVEQIGDYTFSNCTGLTHITIPSTINTVGASAFAGCTNLLSCTIHTNTYISPSALGSTPFFNGRVFGGCNNLREFIIEDDNTAYSSDDGALFNKDKTEFLAYPSVSGEYTIPSSVTRIESYAFYDCANLTSVIIPSSVVSFGSYIIYSCDNVTNVTMLATTPPPIYNDSFSQALDTYTITVPAGCGDAYKAAEGWSNYADIIVEAS